MEDAEFAKTLQSAPTYVGLERVIRYCLIRFAERHKLIVDAAVRLTRPNHGIAAGMVTPAQNLRDLLRLRTTPRRLRLALARLDAIYAP